MPPEIVPQLPAQRAQSTPHIPKHALRKHQKRIAKIATPQPAARRQSGGVSAFQGGGWLGGGFESSFAPCLASRHAVMRPPSPSGDQDRITVVMQRVKAALWITIARTKLAMHHHAQLEKKMSKAAVMRMWGEVCLPYSPARCKQAS